MRVKGRVDFKERTFAVFEIENEIPTIMVSWGRGRLIVKIFWSKTDLTSSCVRYEGVDRM